MKMSPYQYRNYRCGQSYDYFISIIEFPILVRIFVSNQGHFFPITIHMHNYLQVIHYHAVAAVAQMTATLGLATKISSSCSTGFEYIWVFFLSIKLMYVHEFFIAKWNVFLIIGLVSVYHCSHCSWQSWMMYWWVSARYINFSTLAVELCLSCPNPSI